ncbi:ATP adenylyltransferase [Carpediemonas membranifera]|uniref:ATP adenylyltransferase n=1 Tax=Carpediemonas membranifera TaxID=201153 RepID=A0A8J6AUC5_9EUKA|nr:ATP adenylyltransferase [Carpediemonas membranifera]|eukprot:KAG9394936.1 ATP adenylyltransferase [Carpediemonas membranifera]
MLSTGSKAVADYVKNAHAAGLIFPIPTELFSVPDESNNVQFAVQVATSLREKKKKTIERQNSGEFFDPFEDPDPQMLINTTLPLAPKHRLMFNKYNVCDTHFLLITSDFRFQGARLTSSDLAATYHCVKEFDAVAAYNSGPGSGGSQPHKHIHILPQPLVPAHRDLPMDTLVDGPSDKTIRVNLPFEHAAIMFGEDFPFTEENVKVAYTRLLRALERYLPIAEVPIQRLHDRIGMSPPSPCVHAAMFPGVQTPTASCVMGSYNMILTSSHMLIVPRSHEHVELAGESISFNAISFTGLLFLPPTGADLLAALRERGVWKCFESITFPRDDLRH